MVITVPTLQLFWFGGQPHEPSPHGHPVLENALLSAAAGGSVVLLFLPLIVWFSTKSMERTLRVISTSSMWAAILNSVVWVFFTTVVMDKEDCLELVLAYPIILSSNFIYLMIVYGFINSFKMAIAVSSLVTVSLGYVFYAIRFHPDLPEGWEMIGFLGLVSLVWSHACAICDILHIAGRLDFAVYFINVLLNTMLNAATFYIIAKNHPNQQFVVYSSLIGFLMGTLEFMILIKKLVDDNFFRAPNDHAPGNGDNPQGDGDDDDDNGNNPQGDGDADGHNDDDDNGNNPQGDVDADANNPLGNGDAHGNNDDDDDDEDDDDDDFDDAVNGGDAHGEGWWPPGEYEEVKVEDDADDMEDCGNFDTCIEAFPATETDTFSDAVRDEPMKDNISEIVTAKAAAGDAMQAVDVQTKPCNAMEASKRKIRDYRSEKMKLNAPEQKAPQTVCFAPKSKPSELSSSHGLNGEKKSNDGTEQGIHPDKKEKRNAPVVSPGRSWCLPHIQRRPQVKDGVRAH